MIKFLALTLGVITSFSLMAKEVTIYSVYPGEDLAPIFAPFTERTGIEVKFISGTTEELIEKLQSEGSQTSADLYLDKDLTYLGEAQRKGIFRPFTSSVVKSNVPAHLRDKTDMWTLAFYRARVIMYNKFKVSADELSTYEALGDKQWENRLCVRTSTNSYNQALGAYLVKHIGEEKTLEVLSSWVRNFSVEPIKNDRGVIQAIADGQCDVGLANTYYLPAFIRANPDFPVKVFFPNQKSFGAHVNGVGIGIVKHAKNIQEANLLLEYFTSAEVQTPVAAAFSQYPVNPKAEMIKILKDFGSFKEDTTNISDVSNYVDIANRLFPMANYR
ncbi:MAG TPA: extracellular solute-binding protein [Bacteriovoracaceae bacterium]|nr:extracellular solute-binding protein [Bacteriovoracaceae bacterium]